MEFKNPLFFLLLLVLVPYIVWYVMRFKQSLPSLKVPDTTKYVKAPKTFRLYLMHMPFLGSAAIHMGLIPLTRTNPRKDLVTLLERGSECISKGSSMLIFPQGTRQETFSAAKYSSIGAKLAERCGVPLVPIALQTDLEKKGTGLFKDFGKVDLSRPLRFSCGPAIPADKANGGAKAAHAKSFEWIAGKLREWSLPVEDAPRSSAQI